MTTSKPCHWTENEDGYHETGCGHTFAFDDDGPTENGAKFCLYCGGALVEIKWKPE